MLLTALVDAKAMVIDFVPSCRSVSGFERQKTSLFGKGAFILQASA